MSPSRQSPSKTRLVLSACGRHTFSRRARPDTTHPDVWKKTASNRAIGATLPRLCGLLPARPSLGSSRRFTAPQRGMQMAPSKALACLLLGGIVALAAPLVARDAKRVSSHFVFTAVAGVSAADCRRGRASFARMTFSFTTPRRFIPRHTGRRPMSRLQAHVVTRSERHHAGAPFDLWCAASHLESKRAIAPAAHLTGR